MTAASAAPCSPDPLLITPGTGEPPRPDRCFDGLMVVIFGFGAGKQEDLGETVQTVCPNCNNQVALHHVRSKKSVRLYFVPVVPGDVPGIRGGAGRDRVIGAADPL